MSNRAVEALKRDIARIEEQIKSAKIRAANLRKGPNSQNHHERQLLTSTDILGVKFSHYAKQELDNGTILWKASGQAGKQNFTVSVATSRDVGEVLKIDLQLLASSDLGEIQSCLYELVKRRNPQLVLSAIGGYDEVSRFRNKVCQVYRRNYPQCFKVDLGLEGSESFHEKNRVTKCSVIAFNAKSLEHYFEANWCIKWCERSLDLRHQFTFLSVPEADSNMKRLSELIEDLVRGYFTAAEHERLYLLLEKVAKCVSQAP